MEGSIHETAVTLLHRSFNGAHRVGFRKAIQQLQWDHEGWAEFDEQPTWNDFLKNGEVWKEGILPDLWLIDHETMSVVCIEVENGNAISDRKFQSYRNLWWHLDEFYWELHLLVSDRWCNLTPVPVHRFTSMGTVDLKNHRLANVIAAERNKNEIMFKLSKIYCNSDLSEREIQRAQWMAKNPSFTLAKFREQSQEPSNSLLP